MANLRSAVAVRLHSDPTLSGLLGSYGGRAAIIAEDTIPHDVPRPFVSVDAVSLDEPNDTKNTTGRDRSLSIRALVDAKSDDDVDAIAERIRVLLHRQPVSPSGEVGWMASVSGPVIAPTDNTLRGRLLSVTLRTYA